MSDRADRTPALSSDFLVDVTSIYGRYFDLHPILGPAGLPVVGWAPVKMTPAERLLLWTLAYCLRPAVYLEIGIFEGGSARIVASALETARAPGRIVAIDPEPRISEEIWQGLAARTTLLRSRSPEALGQVLALCGPGSVGLALVDGDHDEKAVLADAEALLELLAPGAWVLFHDAHLPGVARAIDGWVRRDPERLLDLGLLTCEFTSEAAGRGNLQRFGGLRGVLFREAGR